MKAMPVAWSLKKNVLYQDTKYSLSKMQSEGDIVLQTNSGGDKLR